MGRGMVRNLWLGCVLLCLNGMDRWYLMRRWENRVYLPGVLFLRDRPTQYRDIKSRASRCYIVEIVFWRRFIAPHGEGSFGGAASRSAADCGMRLGYGACERHAVVVLPSD